MTPVTVLDVALARGAKPDENGCISMGAVEDTGLPFLGGCEVCGATVSCGNSCPSTSGYIRCASGCIGDRGFPSTKAFETWCVYQDALAEAEAQDEQRDQEQDQEG